jgi:hypothetical protein
MMVVIYVLVTILIVGCGVAHLRPATPTPPAPLEDLLIDTADLPAGFTARAPERGEGSGQFIDDDNLENIAQFFKQEDVLVSHWIWRYPSPERARNKHNNRIYQNHEPAAQIPYRSPIAHEMMVQCHPSVHAGMELCIAFIHYGIYYVELASHIDHETMTYRDFEHALEAIDEKMRPIVSVQGRTTSTSSRAYCY